MDQSRVGALTRLPDTEIAGDTAQLPHQILPFTDAQVVQELVAAHAAKRAAGQLAALILEISPEVQIGDEIRMVIGEPGMLLPRGLLTVRWAFPRIGNR
ncbi:Uncharacterised protein [Mycobacteroides abscessus]|nr:Uncharacterised protein [Mycobacteroides abscessus]SHV19190.1 Uncharacterised protein [Mycobacteroides abscessus subsp. abscessus]SHV21904.1 Uncharacterised protein [Mycobacteroides abscessus subsp. abscessus]SIK43371.1 Uncharacterised protein [Mycobacteroides abscessus subsp. abscessus]SKT89878.1 Uncharacterised protein [Mycobacteroides abscessus subsp. abscessus]